MSEKPKRYQGCYDNTASIGLCSRGAAVCVGLCSTLHRCTMAGLQTPANTLGYAACCSAHRQQRVAQPTCHTLHFNNLLWQIYEEGTLTEVPASRQVRRGTSGSVDSLP